MKKLLGVVVTLAAVAFAFVPAQAARKAVGCSSANLEQTETAVEGMADGEVKSAAQKDVAAAQEALLNGKMGSCGAHLNKAMQATTAK